MDGLKTDGLLEIISPHGKVGCAMDALENSAHTLEFDALLKLQQDAGLELDPSFDPADLSSPPGEKTAALWEAYEPVTYRRVYDSLTAAQTKINPPQFPEP